MRHETVRERMRREAWDEARCYLAANIALRAQRYYQNIIEQSRLKADYEENIS